MCSRRASGGDGQHCMRRPPIQPATRPCTRLRKEPLRGGQVGGKQIEDERRVGGQLRRPALAAPLAAAAPVKGRQAAALGQLAHAGGQVALGRGRQQAGRVLAPQQRRQPLVRVDGLRAWGRQCTCGTVRSLGASTASVAGPRAVRRGGGSRASSRGGLPAAPPGRRWPRAAAPGRPASACAPEAAPSFATQQARRRRVCAAAGLRQGAERESERERGVRDGGEGRQGAGRAQPRAASGSSSSCSGRACSAPLSSVCKRPTAADAHRRRRPPAAAAARPASRCAPHSQSR